MASKQVVLTPDEIHSILQDYFDSIDYVAAGEQWQYHEQFVALYGIGVNESNARMKEVLLAMSYAYHNVSVRR